MITRRPFYVIGEVQKPGNYPYVTDMTALNAVAMAGGYTRLGEPRRITVKRLEAGQEKVIKIDAKEMAKSSNAQIFEVLANDVINVEETAW